MSKLCAAEFHIDSHLLAKMLHFPEGSVFSDRIVRLVVHHPDLPEIDPVSAPFFPIAAPIYSVSANGEIRFEDWGVIKEIEVGTPQETLA